MVHTELAQANLYRLRGEHDLAEKQCLGILKRFPNEPEAHSLLGELAVDRGDIPRAIEWYELALDLNPNSAKDKSRLEDLKAQAQSHDTAKIEEQLSIDDKPNPGLWIGIGAFVFLVLGILIYASMRPSTPKSISTIHGTVQAPVENPDTTQPTPPATTDQGKPDEPTAAPAETTPSAPTQNGVPMEDMALLQLIQQHSTVGASITNLTQDPRDKALTITYQVTNPDEARHTGAILARDALVQSPDSLIVTVRGISGDKLVFVADGSRPKLPESDSQGNAPANDTWINNFLQREWSESSSSNPSAASAGESGAPATK